MEDRVIDSWKISEFTRKLIEKLAIAYPEEDIKPHFNTVDGWFKAMEKRGTHYVHRIKGEKVYTQQDLEIAFYIATKRQEGWTLSQIYNLLPEDREVREYQGESEEYGLSSEDHFEQGILKQVKEIREESRQRDEENKRAYNQKLRDLEDRISNFETQEKKLLEDRKKNERILKDYVKKQSQIEMELEEEAITEWNKLPDEKRMIKPGLFSKKIENVSAKMDFIKRYKETHKNERIDELFNSDSDL